MVMDPTTTAREYRIGAARDRRPQSAAPTPVVAITPRNLAAAWNPLRLQRFKAIGIEMAVNIRRV